MRTILSGTILATFVALTALHADEQALKIGIVDFYGLNKVSPAEARRALTFKEGDTIVLAGDTPAFFRSSEERLMQVPGVVRVRFEPDLAERLVRAVLLLARRNPP